MIDFGKTAQDYATHRAGFPDRLFDRLDLRGRVLDLGTGTGTLARGLAARGCVVVALDPSAPLLAQARRLSVAEGLTLETVQATAEETGQPAASFDAVTAGQCWHWFDRPRAAAEILRVLRPGGRLALCHLDWLPLPGTLPYATESLILQHNPDWPYGGLDGTHVYELTDLALAGFQQIESFSFDVEIPYSHAAWRGRIRASAGVAASLPAERVAAFDRDHAALLHERFPADPLPILHRVFAVTARTRGAR